MSGYYEIHFRNQLQKYLYDYEIKYQFRDGYWSESRVQNYIPFVRALTYYSDDIGCNIPRYETRYNILENEFIKDIGYRLIAIGRIYNWLGVVTPDIVTFIDVMIKTNYKDSNRDYKIAQVRSPREAKWWIQTFNSQDVKDYYNNIIKKYSEHFLEAIHKALVSQSAYGFTEMRQDLADIKKILATEFQHTKVNWDEITEKSGLTEKDVCLVHEKEGFAVKYNRFRKEKVAMNEIDKFNILPYYNEDAIKIERT